MPIHSKYYIFLWSLHWLTNWCESTLIYYTRHYLSNFVWAMAPRPCWAAVLLAYFYANNECG